VMYLMGKCHGQTNVGRTKVAASS